MGKPLIRKVLASIWVMILLSGSMMFDSVSVWAADFMEYSLINSDHQVSSLNQHYYLNQGHPFNLNSVTKKRTPGALVAQLGEDTEQDNYFCPQGFTHDDAYHLCVNDQSALGPFPSAMIDQCKVQGGGDACDNLTYGVDFARKLRGQGVCPPGTIQDKATTICVEGDNAFGPFPQSSVNDCNAMGGGSACETMRIHKVFLGIKEVQTPNTQESNGYFCPQGFTHDDDYHLCVNDQSALGPFPSAMIDQCKVQGGGDACENLTYGVDFARKLRGQGVCLPGTIQDKATTICFEGDNAFGPFPQSSVNDCKAMGGGSACETMRINKVFVGIKEASKSNQYFCPEGFDFDDDYSLCVNDQSALGPFSNAMVAECKKQGGGNACDRILYGVDFARKLRGQGVCLPGAIQDMATNICFEGDNAFGPFPQSRVDDCKSMGGGSACETMRINKIFVGIKNTPSQFNVDAILSKISEPNIRNVAKTTIPIILQECQRNGVTNPAQIAYILATAKRESLLGIYMLELANGYAYEPTTKIGRDLGNQYQGDGPRYKGRGFVQITGRSNYQKWSNLLGIDLIANPSKAEDYSVAATILVKGMRDGTFTTQKLSDFIRPGSVDFFNARKIVNPGEIFVKPNVVREMANDAQRFLDVLQ